MKNKYYTSLLFLFFIFITPATALELLYPRNNVFISENPIQFSWERSPVTLPSYKLIISANPDLSAPIINTTVNSSLSSIPIPAVSGTTYYWQVLDKALGIHSEINSFIFIIPDSIGQIAAWYKPESGFIVSGGKISQWNDAIGGANMVQSNEALQPSLINQEPLLNNKPVVMFSGNPQNYFQSTSNVSVTNFSVYCLRNYEDYSVPLQYFLGGNGQGLFSEGDAISGGWGSFNGGLIYTGTTNLINQYSVYLHSNTKLRINNTLPPISSSSPLPGLTFNTLGARPDGTEFAFKGKIAELLVFKQELDNAKDQLVYNYLADKYAPPVNLGQDTILGSSFCDSVTISAGNRFITYLWGNGKTTSSIRVLPNGKHTVTVKDIFGRSSMDDINIFPYQRLDNKTIYLCKGDTFKVDLKTPAGFSVLWNTGATTSQLNITQSGQYRVRVTDASSCFVDDTINVLIDEPSLSPVPDAGNNLTLCEGEKLFLTTATAFDSILWSNGSTENFIAVTNPGNYNVYGITNSGCVINQPFNITIAGKAPVAQFAVPPACQDAPLTFTDTSNVPAGNTIQNWSWTFSNNSTSTLQNPTTLFSSLGTQTVSLKITTNVGCTDSIAKTFTVNRKPIPSFFNLLSCAGNATTFVDQSIANAASLINWKWDFGGLGTSNGIQNPAFRFPDATNYTVKLVATNSNFCSDSITLPVAVNPSPVSDFSFDSVCGRSPISYKFLATVTSPSTITAWNWNFGDGEAETAIRNPQHAYDEPGIYEVSLAVRSSNQCSDTIQKQVRIYDFPNVDFEVSSAQCVGKEIQFTDISSTPDGLDITKWTWYFAGLATSSQQNPRYQFNTEGNYTVQLTATNKVGCSGTKQRSVAVSSLPQPKFTFTPANGLPPLNVSFTNQSPVSGSYVWDYGDGTAPVAAYNPPTHIYTVKGSYPIKLIGTDFRGCVDTLTRYILVDKAYLDGVIAAVILIPNGNFYKVQVTLQNNSNIEITSAGLGLQLGGGAILRETWNGSLLPGRSATFLFTGEVSSGEAQAPVICATIENLNSYAPEDRTDNNTTCKELIVGDFEVFSIYPNPALENINLGVMLPQDGTVSIRLIDYLGQQLNMITFSGIKGYNNFTVNTAALGASVYIAEVAYKDQIIRKKFVRGNSK